VSPAAAGEGRFSAAELGEVRRFIHRATGMMFGQAKAYYIERRVLARMAAAAAPTLACYLARLEEDGAEAQALVNSFTVGETYFFREPAQLELLSRVLLPEATAALEPGGKVRLWSMPCATGEEAYSLAIWLLDHWRMVDAYHVEIVGSDVNTEALELARAGRYGPRAVERLPRTALEAYFEPQAGGGRRLIADLRESVIFTSANLVDPVSMAAQGRFDVIFCRNALIYFDEEARRRAIDLLHARLNPGGFLCLGHAESLNGISDRFRARRLAGATVYQRDPA
jgi:chemotaxis protein methyltransferase CheR